MAKKNFQARRLIRKRLTPYISPFDHTLKAIRQMSDDDRAILQTAINSENPAVTLQNNFTCPFCGGTIKPQIQQSFHFGTNTYIYHCVDCDNIQDHFTSLIAKINNLDLAQDLPTVLTIGCSLLNPNLSISSTDNGAAVLNFLNKLKAESQAQTEVQTFNTFSSDNLPQKSDTPVISLESQNNEGTTFNECFIAVTAEPPVNDAYSPQNNAKTTFTTFNLPPTNATPNIDLEKQVLSSMLIQDGEIIPAVTSILTAEDFYRPEHRIIFNCLVNQFSKLGRTDFVALIQELKTTGDLQKIGIEFVFSLPQISCTTAYTEYHASIIRDIADKRRINDVLRQTVQDTRAGLKTPAEIIADATDAFKKINPAVHADFVDVKIYVMHKWMKSIEDNQQYSNRSTGFSNIDEHQIFSDGIYILGATPAAGKTTFAWQMADQLAAQGETVIFCSYEMTTTELVSKTFARKLFLKNPYDPQAALTASQINKGGWVNQIEEIQYEIFQSNRNLQVLQMQGETIDELISKIRPLCSNVKKAPIVFIDYLQILPPVGKEDDKQKVDNALRKMKCFQRDTHTTFIAVSSFNRGNYFNSVAFESFKDSGNIEYSADVIWALQLNVVNIFKDAMGISKMRKTVDEAKKQQPRQIQLKCLKNRKGNNYDCYFNYYSAHDYFEPCNESDFEVVDVPFDDTKTADNSNDDEDKG